MDNNTNELYDAIRRREDITKLVKDHSPDQTYLGMSMIQHACYLGNYKAVVFLSRFVDVHQLDPTGNNLLFYSVNHPKILKFLLYKKKIKHDQANIFGNIAINRAIIESCAASVNILLRYIKNPDNMFILATINSSEDVIDVIAKKANHIYADDDGNLPIHHMARRGLSITTKYYNNTDIQNRHGYTPLHMAILSGNHNIVGYMLKNKASPYTKTNDSMNIIHLAAKTRSTVMMSTIFRFIDRMTISMIINDRDETNDRMTPLHYAAESNSTSVINMLLSYGAKSMMSSSGNTPVHILALNGNIRAITIMTGYRTNMFVLNNLNMYPIDIAIHCGYIDIYKYLISMTSNTYMHIHYAVLSRNKRMLYEVLEHEHDINEKELQGNTPLHYATYMGEYQMAKALVESGADINSENDEKMTPLHMAVYSGDCIMVMYILNKKPKIINNVLGLSPLHIASINNKIIYDIIYEYING